MLLVILPVTVCVYIIALQVAGVHLSTLVPGVSGDAINLIAVSICQTCLCFLHAPDVLLCKRSTLVEIFMSFCYN